MPAFKLDPRRWTPAELITLIATAVLFVSLFLPWFTYNFGFGSISVDGLWHGWMYLTLLISLAVIVYLVARAGFAEMPVELPVSGDRLLLVATGADAVLTVVAFAFKPGGAGLSGIGWGYGAVVGLVAAVGAALPYALPVIQARRATTRPAPPRADPEPPTRPAPPG